jgi:hypothetical protein
MIRWMGIQAEIDPRPGGMYRLGQREVVIRGEYARLADDGACRVSAQGVREVVPREQVQTTAGYCFVSGTQTRIVSSTRTINAENLCPPTLRIA